MKKFDTFLFGYGLTINILNKIIKNYKIDDQIKRYLDFNEYLRDLVFKEEHSFVWRDFSKKFDEGTIENVEARLEAKEMLKDRYDEIVLYGFERWVSKYLFNEEKNVDKNIRMFVYILYNHWADLLWRQVFVRKDIKNYLKQVAAKICDLIENNIYTTNYDIFFDDYIKIDHIHGKFVIPMKKFNQIVTPFLNDKNRFEYSYLFGGGGIEKYNRLNDISKMNIKEYDLNFFYDDNINLGRLLIYGLSFARTEYITDEFLEKFPKYRKDYLFLSIDGHIIKKLREKFENNKLESIVITYYKIEEKEYLENLFTMADMSNIVEFVESKSIDIKKTI